MITFLEQMNTVSDQVREFIESCHSYSQTGQWDREYQIYTSGWSNLDGVMIIYPDNSIDADYMVLLIALTERSLRELLLSYPRHTVGLFSLSEKWMEERIQHILDYTTVPSQNEHLIRGVKRGSRGEVEHRNVNKRKDAIASHMRKLSTLKGKIEQSQFIVEGDMAVQRAFNDGLPIQNIAYTTKYSASEEGINFLKQASQENVSTYNVNDGVMGSISTTRPIPKILASVDFNYTPFLLESGELNFQFSSNCTLLITENIENPDNLGMTLRTADAAGVSAVLVNGNGANPFHKNCVRASRGAVGRLPLFYVESMDLALEALKSSGWRVFGATSNTEKEFYETKITFPNVVIVGNENTGITTQTLEMCTDLARISMAPGQSSLNVGVATGVILFEITRQKRA